MEKLRITLVQSHLDWEDKIKNRSRFEQLTNPLAGKTDLIILPEMFTTGFTMQPAAVAEGMEGETVSWMLAQAKKLSAVVTGSIVIQEGDHYFNRLIWAEPEGRLLHYDKRHLFGMAGEGEHYSSGNQRLIIDYQGWRICPLICYDLRFPVWSRNTDDIDLLIYVANWPEKRSADWRSLITARAIENQCYVAAVNRVGTDANGHLYRGDSSLICPGPRRLLCSIAGIEATPTLEISKPELMKVRKQLPFLADRDSFKIELIQ